MKPCPECNGSGVVNQGTDNEERCPECGGKGFVPDDQDDEQVLNTLDNTSEPRTGKAGTSAGFRVEFGYPKIALVA
jgi:DnaJ-class molecular chaperone